VYNIKYKEGRRKNAWNLERATQVGEHLRSAKQKAVEKNSCLHQYDITIVSLAQGSSYEKEDL